MSNGNVPGAASRAALMTLTFLTVSALARAEVEKPCEAETCESSWLQLNEAARERVFALAADYMSFMAKARTELTAVHEAELLARDAGFRPWEAGERIEPGSRWYVNNRDRSMALFVVGEQPVADGVRIVASHIDSPRLELKARPLYESGEFALLQTTFHGSILNYEWTNTPLALIGRVSRKDGTSIDISVGLDEDDPVFMVAGLSPHVDIDLRERTYRDALLAEELDPIAGSLPKSAEEGIKAQVTEYLRETYDVGIEDLVSAELALVPAGAPRDVGFDRAMMAMYGQDDRLGAYTSLRALLELEDPARTTIVYLADNEETGNNNNTGAGSDFLSNVIGELLYTQIGDEYREPHLRRALTATQVLAIDVNDAVNPTWPSAWEVTNAPRVGHGVNIKVYGSGNNAATEYSAWIRSILDGADIPWQTVTYKVGRAGGGTLGGELSRRNMNVIDVGAPVLSLHNTFELSSKVDVWWLYQACAAFFSTP